MTSRLRMPERETQNNNRGKTDFNKVKLRSVIKMEVIPFAVVSLQIISQ